MKFTGHVSLLACVLFLGGCSATAETQPNDGRNPPESQRSEPGADAALSADAAAPSAPDASTSLTPGPSFTVQAEELRIDAPGAPSGQSPSYVADTDPTTLESGKAAMLLASTAGTTAKAFGATTATHAVDATVAGRRYRMRAKIKTEDAASAWLWWRIDVSGTPGFVLIDNMGNPEDRRIRGTKDWQEVWLVMDVPMSTKRFAFGSGLTGPGKAWVGQITFDEVGLDVPTTPHFKYEQ